MRLVALLAAMAAAASALVLTKRCSPLYDPEYHHGYRRPAPCWLTFDTSCYNYIAIGSELYINKNLRLVIVTNVSASCSADIAEELAREKDGRKTNEWTKYHGRLNDIGGGILVISAMDDDALQFYEKLTPYETRGINVGLVAAD